MASLVALSGALAACGDSTPGTGLSYGDRLDAVTVEGDFGAAAVSFDERMQAGDDLEVETTIEGDGPALADGDEIFLNYLIGNGAVRATTTDTFAGDDAPIAFVVGADENAEPQTFDDVVRNLLLEHVTAGVTKGSRLVLTGNTRAFFGDLADSPALATEGIGNDDGLIMVVDVMDVTPLAGPEKDADEIKRPAWAPRIDYGPTGPRNFTFAPIGAAPKPTDPLEVAVLRTGTGDEVEVGDLLVARYMGSVYDGEKPFDETFSKGKEPIELRVGDFVEGFNEALTGKTVGSRVIMRIPPAKGYGDQANGDAIPANSTLYFVVDILAAV
ncbi:FKBP-type peptidyl-prolyl cis-trans isomerase [Nocardioides sp. C4-1]|uniref:FKBP-type peptidyl-prolyl cis-trans isomerase n=1 Tax=Nocardioides sp. C4-1 TaxID=3151851 RepID=UPI003263E22E